MASFSAHQLELDDESSFSAIAVGHCHCRKLPFPQYQPNDILLPSDSANKTTPPIRPPSPPARAHLFAAAVSDAGVIIARYWMSGRISDVLCHGHGVPWYNHRTFILLEFGPAPLGATPQDTHCPSFPSTEHRFHVELRRHRP